MKKYILIGLALLAISITMPVFAQADAKDETVVQVIDTTTQDVKEYPLDESTNVPESPGIRTTTIEDTAPVVTYTRYATNTVNIRQEPDTESVIFGQLARNTAVEVLSEEGGWSEICLESGMAYVKSDYLSSMMVPERTYTDEDLYVLAHIICGEAQGYSDDEQRYVGSVVLNRVSHPEFPDSIVGVAFDPGQYACIKDGNYNREPTASNWKNAQWLLENGSVLPENVVWQARGRQGRGIYLETKWHKYCY